MANQQPLFDKDGEVRELTAEDMATFKPVSEVLPVSLQSKLGVCNLQKADSKECITIQLAPDVAEYFRSIGKGWQIRVDEVLRKYVEANR